MTIRITLEDVLVSKTFSKSLSTSSYLVACLPTYLTHYLYLLLACFEEKLLSVCGFEKQIFPPYILFHKNDFVENFWPIENYCATYIYINAKIVCIINAYYCGFFGNSICIRFSRN